MITRSSQEREIQAKRMVFNILTQGGHTKQTRHRSTPQRPLTIADVLA